MDTLTIFFGLITMVSFFFAIYQHYRTKKHAVIEESKIIIQSEKLGDIYENLRSLGSNVDMLIQIPKNHEVTIQELQNIARGARSQIYVLMKIIKGEQERLEEWRYGKMISSKPVEEDNEKIEIG